MRFLGRAVVICVLAGPAAAAGSVAAHAAAETFAGAPTLGAVTSASIGSLLREPGIAAGLRDVRMLDDFYRTLGYRPAWQSAGGGWSDDARRVLRRLQAADDHGLDPADYASPRLVGLIADAGSGHASMRGDVALSVALLRFLDHASNGRIKPSRAGWDVWHHPRSAFAVEAATALSGGRIADYVERAGPPGERYAALRSARAHYVALAGEPYPRIGEGPTLRVGDRAPEVAVLRRQLRVLGDIEGTGDAVAGRSGDWRPPHFVLASAVAGETQADLELYDSGLETAVQAFQRRHGLAVDGAVGPATRRALDRTPRERLEQIDLALERLRWMPVQRGERHVLVNVPGAELVAVNKGVERLRMRVVTGLPDWQTPIFSDEIVNLKFAPTWTIPVSIVRKDTLPRVRRDPGYLAANSIRVLRGGQEINPWSVDWHGTGPGEYVFRQDSGPASALGGVRFSLTNNNGIFLHDTPSRRYFQRAERALSHGCVRVADPVALSAFLLEEQGGWDDGRIREAMGAARERYQTLRAPVPVHIVYLTAWAEDGTVQFRDDVYGLDRKLADLLAARPTG
ncbi:MAG: murein L,D-transpeptidase [Alphaproteobacteria bacterium]